MLGVGIRSAKDCSKDCSKKHGREMVGRWYGDPLLLSHSLVVTF